MCLLTEAGYLNDERCLAQPYLVTFYRRLKRTSDPISIKFWVVSYHNNQGARAGAIQFAMEKLHGINFYLYGDRKRYISTLLILHNGSS